MGDQNTITRREVLAGLGVVGVGMGADAAGYDVTAAALSDVESFVANILTAGELDLEIGYEITSKLADGRTGGDAGTVNGDPPSGVAVDTLRPGDTDRIDLDAGARPHGNASGRSDSPAQVSVFHSTEAV